MALYIVKLPFKLPALAVTPLCFSYQNLTLLFMEKKRLDELCLERFQQYSRTFIQSWILQGKVYVNGKMVNKDGTPVSDKAVVEIIAEIPKGGYKLEAAIEQLGVDAGKIALDSGLSTGGFTELPASVVWCILCLWS